MFLIHQHEFISIFYYYDNYSLLYYYMYLIIIINLGFLKILIIFLLKNISHYQIILIHIHMKIFNIVKNFILYHNIYLLYFSLINKFYRFFTFLALNSKDLQFFFTYLNYNFFYHIYLYINYYYYYLKMIKISSYHLLLYYYYY